MTGTSDRSTLPKSVLVFAPSSFGGIAEHTRFQAAELARRGVIVTMLTRVDSTQIPPAGTYRQLRVLPADHAGRGLGRVKQVLAATAGYYLLALWVLRLRPDLVLLEANSEYFAPLWAWPHLLLSRLVRVPYLANFHDPHRARHFGPAWLHAWSVSLANAVLWGGLIHGTPPPEAGLPARLKLMIAPIGHFDRTEGGHATFDLRERLGIDGQAFVLLAFGHLADRKNLDLLITALADVADVQLVIAGEATSGSQRPAQFYRDLAERTGVGSRVHFVTSFIADHDIPAYFRAADAVALTYNREFVSQSGVLQHAVDWSKPILASSGPGPLRETVVRHRLGVFVEPDDSGALADGLRRLLRDRPPTENFLRYRDSANWGVNVDRLIELYGQFAVAR
ncbi:glycosyltransferase [Novosphingobium sp.]|uniref:glycosyltransferase n=1 Tax=Novosphingobium sp. TaxID=1874826 RepID=UPI00260141AC|nr:glycosyltransferase [Novosphingobium sp.]